MRAFFMLYRGSFRFVMKSLVTISRRGRLLGLTAAIVLTGPAAYAQAPLAEAEVSVYPNPAHIRATVAVPAVAGVTRATVTLVDPQGAVVFEQPVSLPETGGTAEVPLLGKAPGLYRVLVQVGNQRVARTLTVE